MVRTRTIAGRGGVIRPVVPYDQFFSENLKAARLSKRLTQEIVGDPLNMTKRTICRLERKEHGPTLMTAAAIAESLGFTLVEMLLPPREFLKLLKHEI